MTSHKKYMIILQDTNVIGTCFSDSKFWLHDGAISVGWITSQGKVQEIHRGTLVNGHFDLQDNGE